jgi:hypothetical protein
MKFAAHAALAIALIFTGSAFAAGTAPAKSLTPQQQKMKDCNAQATGKKGDERKTFMSMCLKGGSTATAPAAAPAVAAAAPAAPAKPMTQQEKMKTCNADAGSKHLAGDARKTFMSTCLKGSGAAAAAH